MKIRIMRRCIRLERNRLGCSLAGEAAGAPVFQVPLFATLLCVFVLGMSANAQDAKRPRAREAGVIVGVPPTGPLNAITDVAGVAIGHSTIVKGNNIRTGVTAILPHGGNLFREKVPGAVFIGNAFGKLAGSTQVNELGEIETPIMLTST